MGEGRDLTPGCLTPGAIASFFYLLVVGSFVGFIAFNWLLGHASVALTGTYAYVNPVIALLVGWLVANETPTNAVVAGVAVILVGVALVRLGRRAKTAAPTVPSVGFLIVLNSKGGRALVPALISVRAIEDFSGRHSGGRVCHNSTAGPCLGRNIVASTGPRPRIRREARPSPRNRSRPPGRRP